MVLPPIARRTPPTAVRGPLMAQPPQDTRRLEFTLRVVGWHHAPALRAGEGVDCEVRIPRAAGLGFAGENFATVQGVTFSPRQASGTPSLISGDVGAHAFPIWFGRP